MVRIRLVRMGRVHLPFYRIVISPLREKQNSKAIEYVGTHNPFTKKTDIDLDRVKYWLSVGAQPSETVKSMLIKAKLIKADKKPKKYNQKPGKKAAQRKEAAANQNNAPEIKKEEIKAQ